MISCQKTTALVAVDEFRRLLLICFDIFKSVVIYSLSGLGKRSDIKQKLEEALTIVRSMRQEASSLVLGVFHDGKHHRLTVNQLFNTAACNTTYSGPILLILLKSKATQCGFCFLKTSYKIYHIVVQGRTLPAEGRNVGIKSHRMTKIY